MRSLMSISVIRLCIVIGVFMYGWSTAYAELKLPAKSPEVQAADSSTLGQIDSGYGLVAGSQVPNFRILDHFGQPADLEALRQRSNLLVIFYRGGWCPYCNRQIRNLTKAYPEFEKRGILPVLISADQPDGAAVAQRGYEIPFPVLSDPKLIAHEAFKVSLKLDEAMVQRLSGFGIDLEAWSGESHHTIAVSSAFLVDQSGKVLWSHSDLDYKKRPKVNQLLSVIDGL